MRFYKYHGAGNDFILIDNREERIKQEYKPDLAQKLCNRHFGVGGDGMILVEPSLKADARMRIFNPDGTEAEMCGNGIRCFGRYLFESGTRKQRMAVETLAGVKQLSLVIENGIVKSITIEMGPPLDVSLNKNLRVNDHVFEYSFVDTGVPHVVIFVDDVETVNLEVIAPGIRFNPVFPKGTNVNFVEPIKKRSFKIRTYERGVEKETLACGTGISAAGVAAVFQGRAEEDEELEFMARGGNVHVMVERKGGSVRVFMKGTAEFVFEGEFPLTP